MIKKDDVKELAKKYSKDIVKQETFIAGFQEACNIVREKFDTCYNEEFCDEMEALSDISYIDFSNI